MHKHNDSARLCDLQQYITTSQGMFHAELAQKKHDLMWKKHPTFSPLHLLDSTGFTLHQ